MSSPNSHRSACRFLRHYAEMVAVMFAGMFALMAPTGVLLGAFGTSWSRLSPAMNVFTMALTMTIPMVAWMRYRGHAWRPNLEMGASMLIPTFAVMGLLSADIGTSDSLMIPEHAGMLSCMLAAMLYRRDEYSCGRTTATPSPRLRLEARTATLVKDMSNTSTKTSETSSLRVIIVGGGIGGLSAAIALRRRGHEPVVLERARNVTAAERTRLHLAPHDR